MLMKRATVQDVADVLRRIDQLRPKPPPLAA